MPTRGGIDVHAARKSAESRRVESCCLRLPRHGRRRSSVVSAPAVLRPQRTTTMTPWMPLLEFVDSEELNDAAARTELRSAAAAADPNSAFDSTKERHARAQRNRRGSTLGRPGKRP